MTAPYSGIQIPQPGTSLQRARRVWRVYTDQHGRRFGAQADMGNNAPIGEFQPQGFIPPWLPTMRYAKFSREGDLDFRWDYDTVAEEWSGQAAAYYEEATKLALQLPGDVPVPEVGGVVDRRVRALVGPAPLSPAIPLACKAGDPWILGRLGATDSLGLKAVLEQQTGANGQEALRLIRERLDAVARESGVVPVPTIPEKPMEVEKARTIYTIDTVDAVALAEELDALTWPKFLNAAKQRGKLTVPEIAAAWADFKKDRDAMQQDGASGDHSQKVA